MGGIHLALDRMLSVWSSRHPPGNGASILFYVTCPQFVTTPLRAKDHITRVSAGLERLLLLAKPRLWLCGPQGPPLAGLGPVANLQAVGLVGCLLTPRVGDGREDV